MSQTLSFLVAGILVLASASLAHAQDAAFDALVDDYLAHYCTVYPSTATDLGIRGHDRDLEDYSQEAVKRELTSLHEFDERFAKIDAKSLSKEKAIDLEVVRGHVQASVLELDRVQGWRHRADFYTGLANESVYVLMKRPFAPEAERLACAIAREEKIPRLFEQARANLTGVPRVNIEMTLDDLPGAVSFFREDVRRAFADALAHDPELAKSFEKSTELAARAVEEFKKFLEEKVAPHAPEAFALGEELFTTKLAAEEMLKEPLADLLRRGEDELHRLQGEFKATAARLDPKKSPQEVQKDVTADHPTADRVIAETQGRLALLRSFVVEHGIATIPSDTLPRVEETPVFMRETTLASIFTPSPFDPSHTDAIYNVTLADPAWPAEKTEDWLRGAFSRPTIDVTSIHEAFPGHYVQYVWLLKNTSKVRKFAGANSNVEGWAHYCEQMALDEGFGGGDPKLRLAQLQDALLRAARYVVGIRMHTRGMSLADAERFFQEEGYQSKSVAEVEVRRGTEDPTYLYYTWGKLEILRLREDWKKARGSAFSLKDFHDAFLAQGPIPLPLMRRALLGEGDSGTGSGSGSGSGTNQVEQDIRRWAKALESKNGWVSLDALDYLPYFGRAAVPALLDELAGQSSTGRLLAAVALGRIPDARAVEPLIARLDDRGALELRTLSEDGETTHAVYPGPELTVGQEAEFALEAITGERHKKADAWRAYWEKAKATFVAREPASDPAPLPPEARWLRGVRICVDPGHGGDRSKVGYKRGLTYLSEADVNLRVGRYVRDLLVRAGAEPVLTRDGDVDVSLKARARMAGDERCDLFLSIHHNWSPRLDQTATTTWYHLTPDEKPASIDVARYVEAGVCEAFGVEAPPSGGLMSDHLIYEHGFGVLRDLPPDVPGALCEATYYSNFGVERKLRDLDFLKREALGLVRGLGRYLGAGIPRAELASATADGLVLRVHDGLGGRGDGALPNQVFAEHVIARVDGKVVAHEFDRASGTIAVKGPFAAGAHAAEVVLLNINKNHSWPRTIAFEVK
jgi:uncharacterized protein (DUF885 family)/N-acetylmuramoyl-L-alanine amidase